MAEPSNTTTDAPSSGLPSASNSRPSTSSLPGPRKLFSSQTTSATSSPRPSRESSPIRPELKSNLPGRGGGARSRKNSTQEPSPTRSTSAASSTVSTAVGSRKTLSTNIPHLYPSLSEPTIKSPIPQKPEARETPRWPVSPRLRSPPPIVKPLTTLRKADSDPTAIHAPRSTVTTEGAHPGADADDSLVVPGMRTPVRGASGTGFTLETVQENSHPGTPARLDSLRQPLQDGPKRMLEQVQQADQSVAKPLKAKSGTSTNESGSDSSGNKGEMKMRSASAAPTTSGAPATSAATSTKSMNTIAAAARGKPSGEGSAKNMTVETETVSSIPQVAVGGGTGGLGINGTIRAKLSSETIRPKKEKRKSTRKTPSINAGIGEAPDLSDRRVLHRHSARSLTEFPMYIATRPDIEDRRWTSRSSSASPLKYNIFRRTSLIVFNASVMLMRESRAASSKADIFEAKIASAVDEANSSDSEETFVYESNPPEVNERPRRFHSRTPSATSMASQVGGSRSIQGVMDTGHGVTMKKSMKFTNVHSSGPDVGTGDDDGKGTVRSNVGTGRGATHRHHIGRWGRNGGGNGHHSLFDNESPFPNAAKSKLVGNGSSRPSSPRVSHIKLANGKKGASMSSSYDIDDSMEADSERTPLLGGTIRSSRSGRNRRQPFSTVRQLEHQGPRRDPSLLNRFAGCLVLSILVLLVVSGAIGFMFATTQPLSEVKIVDLKHVIASGDELILDMVVSARNPNIVVVSVEAMDIDLFARSKHLQSDFDYWRDRRPSSSNGDRPRHTPMIHTRDDDISDPLDPPVDEVTIKLGSVYVFDAPLLFDGSLFHRAHSNATGELRLASPGNTTGTIKDDSERWQKVLKYEFDLILKGTLRYQLPMSQRVRNVTIDGKVTVIPGRNDQKLVKGLVDFV